MFKNKDGSYNKGSVAISLFILFISSVMLFSYIFANVTFPTIKFDNEPSTIVQNKSINITVGSEGIYPNNMTYNWSSNYTTHNSSATILYFNTSNDNRFITPSNISDVSYVVVGGGGGGASRYAVGGGGTGAVVVNYTTTTLTPTPTPTIQSTFAPIIPSSITDSITDFIFSPLNFIMLIGWWLLLKRMID